MFNRKLKEEIMHLKESLNTTMSSQSAMRNLVTSYHNHNTDLFAKLEQVTKERDISRITASNLGDMVSNYSEKLLEIEQKYKWLKGIVESKAKRIAEIERELAAKKVAEKFVDKDNQPVTDRIVRATEVIDCEVCGCMVKEKNAVRGESVIKQDSDLSFYVHDAGHVDAIRNESIHKVFYCKSCAPGSKKVKK